MSLIKTLERAGKRILIRGVCRVVRTRKIPAADIRANPPHRVLVVRQHHQMGDMLLAVPAFGAIKASYGGAEVAVVTARINRDVVLDHPYVDHVYTYNNRNPFSWLGLIRALRRHRYDMVIVLHTVSFSFTSAALGLLSGARIRVGSTSEPFGNALSAAFYHCELPLPTADELSEMNEAEHNLYPLRAIGIDTGDLAPIIVPDTTSVRWAESFVRDHGGERAPFVVVHPGAGKAENIWPPEHFAAVARRLVAERGVRVFALEGPRDAVAVSTFSQRLGSPVTVVGSRGIGDVAALLKKADLVLCNDTGVMHVSAAAGAHTLAVFGPTDPIRWAPRSPSLHIVRHDSGRLDRVSVESVAERALQLLDSGGRRAGARAGASS